MESLQPRAKRIDLSFAVVFQDGQATVLGHCLNLSESGMLATFVQPLELWVVGDIEVKVASLEGKLRARVARVDEQQAGLSFIFRAESERVLVRELLAFAAARTHLVGRPAF